MTYLEQIENLEMHILWLSAEIILTRCVVDKIAMQFEQRECLNEIEHIYKLWIAEQMNGIFNSYKNK